MPAEVIIKPELPPLPPAESATAPVLPPATLCANCGRTLYGPYCCDCGQHYMDFHRSVWRFVVDFFDNVFGWDNKVFRTLRPLVMEPGAVTLDYLAGRRVRYVHPLRLFLFTSAICLTIIQYFGGSPVVASFDEKPDKKHHGAGFTWKVNDSKPTPTPAAEASPTPVIPTPSPAEEEPPAGQHDGDKDNERKDNPAEGVFKEVDRSLEKVKSINAEDIGERIARATEARLKADGGPARLQKNVTDRVQRWLPYVVLALLPIFAVMLRAVYWRYDAYYFSHLVFSLHFHTFLLLFGAADALLHWIMPTSFGSVRGFLSALTLLPGVYLFLALRRLYGESIKRTLVKVCVLGGLQLLVLVIGLACIGGLAYFQALS